MIVRQCGKSDAGGGMKWAVNIFLPIKRMSTVLGAVSLFSLFLAVYGTFQNQGEALVKYGMGVLFALLFALTGIVLGIMSKMEEDKFYLFLIWEFC